MSSTPFDFAAFTEGLEEEPRAGVTTHIEGLTKGHAEALKAEQGRVGALTKQLNDLAKKAEAGESVAKELEAINVKLAASEFKNAFLSGASSAGVAAANIDAAFKLLAADNLVRADGSPDFDLLKKSYPVLFAAQRSVTGAGEGDETKGKVGSMNEYIRAAAGIG